MNKEELKPCPSCGGNPDIYEFGSTSVTIMCGCGWNCGDCLTEDEARKTWNTRKGGSE